jgi:hypothetical protein
MIPLIVGRITIGAVPHPKIFAEKLFQRPRLLLELKEGEKGFQGR